MSLEKSCLTITGADAVALAEKAFIAGDISEASYFIALAYHLFDLQIGEEVRNTVNDNDCEPLD